MKLVHWLISVTAWDGILPLAGVASLMTVQLAFPRNDIAEVTAAIFVPMLAAMVRAAIAVKQLKRRCNGMAPLGRQIALAAAIILLLLLEIGSSILTFAKDEPLSAWCWPLAFYLAYLTSICWALRPTNGVLSITTT